MPHAILDVTGACNIRCDGCYNARPDRVKPVDEIRRELDQLRRLRRLHTVTLSGGEPTLHPDLAAIVKSARDLHLEVTLLTNGSTLDDGLLETLRQAGLSAVLLHVQAGQEREDLPPDAAPEAVRKRREDLAERVARHGMEAGLSVIAYRSRLDELRLTIRDVLESPHLNFLLVTEFTDFSRFRSVSGRIETGLKGAPAPAEAGASRRDEEVTSDDIRAMMDGLGLSPYAFVGSSHADNSVKWLSYLVGVVRTAAGVKALRDVKAGLSDRLLLRLVRVVSGRYPFFHKSGPGLFRLRLFLNALSGGHPDTLTKLLAPSLLPGRSLLDKHLVFQEGPRLLPSGEIDCCSHCPDAVIVGGALVPVCLADRLETASRCAGHQAGQGG